MGGTVFRYSFFGSVSNLSRRLKQRKEGKQQPHFRNLVSVSLSAAVKVWREAFVCPKAGGASDEAVALPEAGVRRCSSQVSVAACCPCACCGCGGV